MEKILEQKKFNSSDEELAYLRKIVAEKEIVHQEAGIIPEREKIISQTIEQYKNNDPVEKLEKGHLIPEKIQEEIVLELTPEEHDHKMSELIALAQEKGILNVLYIIERMNDPHIQDDFHRFLIQYIKEGYHLNGLNERSTLSKTIGRTLFEVTLSDYRGDQEKNFQELFALMEQFYAGMLSLKDDYLTFEIANSIGSRQFIFYISVSDRYKDLFEKQLLSVFTDAKIFEQKNDFNIFNEKGYSIGSAGLFASAPAKTLKTFDAFQSDPLKVILNVFSKIDVKDEAAAIQFIFKPVGDFYLKNYKKAVSRLEKGESAYHEMNIRNNFISRMMKNLSTGMKTVKEITNEKKDKSDKIKNDVLETVRKKIENQIVSTNIRIIASAQTENRTKNILHEITSAFNQFENTGGNKLKFSIFNRSNNNFFKKFSYREFDQAFDMPMNLKECATIFHFPSEEKDLTHQLKTLKSATAPAPLEISTDGVMLGYNHHRNIETPIHFSPIDRMRHFYIIGQTGAGKSTITLNMIKQDIENGDGVCFIDPHGSDVQSVLSIIPPERYDDVIYFDPAYTERPMALNMLEYDSRYPEQKTFVVNELFSIFWKLYGEANPEGMGPMFEQYFRNSTLLVVEDPETGNTLLEVSRVMSDKKFRDLKLSRCKNPVVIQFWREIAEKAGGEASLANIVPYIVSKFDVFLANEIMRPVIAQEKSSFDFRKIMDEKKILLVNLSKGRLGEINSSLIGLILVGKILMAALSRVDSLGVKEIPPFYLYLDEFQNFSTNSISTILSEARKYKLSLNLAHQFIAQLDEKIRDSVFGNVGSMAVYRVGVDDAKFLESIFAPTFSAKDLMNIDNFNCYMKMLSNGVPIKPFNIKALGPLKGNKEQVDSLKELSYLTYGRPREEVEEEIMKKYLKPKPEKLAEVDFNSFI